MEHHSIDRVREIRLTQKRMYWALPIYTAAASAGSNLGNFHNGLHLAR